MILEDYVYLEYVVSCLRIIGRSRIIWLTIEHLHAQINGIETSESHYEGTSNYYLNFEERTKHLTQNQSLYLYLPPPPLFLFLSFFFLKKNNPK